MLSYYFTVYMTLNVVGHNCRIKLHLSSFIAVGDEKATCPKPATSPRIAADKRLRNCLMETYNQDVLPVQNASDKVTILFDMKFIQIVNLVGAEQCLP